MQTNNENNKRIAKNTFFLYIRMLLIMAVSLYTSRVVLKTLGVEDFGIYNVVGGVVSMFSFLNGTISGATQRFLSYEIGTNNKERLQKVFNTAVGIHIIISVLILFLAETIGLWFVLNKLVIPEDRMTASIWVYQFSVASSILFLMSMPYNACIIAHEKMGAFAYITVIDVVLKLLIVYLLQIGGFDKLILYAVLMFVVQLTIRFIYNIYCTRHFAESKYKLEWDKSLAKEMTGFAAWTLFGGFASIGFSQGINILLNMFFGPVVNAARAIAVQVDNAIQSFVNNFQTAVNPQIIKQYAANNMNEVYKLVFAGSRYSFYLLLFMAIPVFFEATTILNIWLDEVPDHTVNFLRITILVLLIGALSGPLITASNATGRIKEYQIIVGSILLLIVPIAYFALINGCNPEFVFWIYFSISFIAQTARLLLIRKLIKLSLRRYFKEVVIRISLTTIVALLLPFMVYYYLPESLLRLLITTVVSTLSVGVVVYSLGISHNERIFLKGKASQLVSRFNKK